MEFNYVIGFAPVADTFGIYKTEGKAAVVVPTDFVFFVVSKKGNVGNGCGGVECALPPRAPRLRPSSAAGCKA
ncbi:MAG TPA: hypothetical protein PK715_17505, partial [Chitinophagales bacterium]|nr:hypothetical protein [Chitinophagales bacterium]